MIKRNIPFGYKMTSGEIIINEPEAAEVRKVFRLYLSGASLRDIAGDMTVPYNAGVSWDKHKVKRVLDNQKYTGKSGYPALVDEHDFLVAGSLKSDKNVGTPIPRPPEIQLLKTAAACHDCGGRLIRKVSRCRSARWRCLNQCCGNKLVLADDELENIVCAILNDIIRNQAMLESSRPHYQDSLAVIKLQNEINREMSKSKPDAGTQKLLFSLAAEKYAVCRDIHSTLTLRTIFKKHKPAAQFDCGLFDAAVDKVLVSKNADIKLRLKNGQLLPRQDSL